MSGRKRTRGVPLSDRYSEFLTNPQFDDVVIGLEKIKDFSPDLVVGLGGGSVLDMAKLLSIFYQKVPLTGQTCQYHSLKG